MTKQDVKRFTDNLKRQAQEKPLEALAIATALLIAVAKVMDANTQRSNSKAWAREVDRRVASSRYPK